MTKIKNRTTLKITYKSLISLINHAQNARVHSEDQVNEITASIKEFGWTNPVLIDENNEIIAGHGRVLAAKKLGITELPCIILAGLTDLQKRAYRIADNKLPLNAEWDEELLELSLQELMDEDYNIALTGFTKEELDNLINSFDDETKPLPEINELSLDSVVKLFQPTMKYI